MPYSSGHHPPRLLVAAALASAAVGLAVQARFNGALVAETGNPLEIGLLNIAAGLLLGTVLVVASSRSRAAWVRMVATARSGRLRWWEFLGGVAGIALVTLQSATVAVLGVAMFSVGLVAGQTASGAVMDRLGWATGQRMSLNAMRIASVVLAVLAVAVSAADRLGLSSASGALPAVLIVLSVIGGAASSAQTTLNGRIVRVIGQPIAAAWASFVVSGLVGLLIMAALVLPGRVEVVALPVDRPWLLFAGMLGLLYVVAAAWAVRPLGLLMTAVLTVVGSLGGALVIDLVAPVPGARAGWALVLGVALAACAAAFAARGRLSSGPR